MSLRTKDPSAHDLGAVLIEARLLTSELMSQFNKVGRYLDRSGAASSRQFTLRQDMMRSLAAPTFARSQLWGALYSANCYFAYMKVFIELAETSFVDVKTAAIDAAHIHADVVPIELFNAQETMKSPEFLHCASIKHDEMVAIFGRNFPFLAEARDSVAHAHDRIFARYRKKSLDADIGSRSLSLNGKSYLSADGADFCFDFRSEKFSSFLSDLTDALGDKCV